MEVKIFQSFFQFSCNVYVINSEKSNLLIDPGHYDQKIKNYLQKQGGLDFVLLTHGHWDHSYGLDALKKDFPKASIFMPIDGLDFLTNPDLNGSSLNGFNLIVKEKVNGLNEGRISLGSYDIDVINTPGHCKGCVMYYFRNEKILFTGDSILKDVAVPIRLTGSKEEQQNTILKFINLGYQENTPVYPGHGEKTTYGYLLRNNIEVKELRK